MIKYVVAAKSIVKDSVFIDYDAQNTYVGEIRTSELWLNAVGTILLISFDIKRSIFGYALKDKKIDYILARGHWYEPRVDAEGNRSLLEVSPILVSKLNRAFLLHRLEN